MARPPLSDPWMASRYGGRFNAHLHAMGAVLVGYNLLEQVFRIKFAVYLGCQPKIAGYLYDVLADSHVRQVTTMAVEASKLPEEVKEREGFFIKAVGKCAENRSHVAHSFLKGGGGDAEVLEKWSKRTFDEEIHFEAPLNEIRRVADEIHRTTAFGRDMTYYVWKFHRENFPSFSKFKIEGYPGAPSELPDKPPEPTLLKLRSLPNPTAASHPPR